MTQRTTTDQLRNLMRRMSFLPGYDRLLPLHVPMPGENE